MIIGKRTLIKIAVLLICTALFIAYCTWQNNDITTTELTVESGKIPEEFDGFRIVQISDVHNALFGEAQSKLLERLREASPDIIVITGDLISWNTEEFDNIAHLLRGAVDICGVYYVAGNHEISSDSYGELLKVIKECGVTVLEDEIVPIVREGAEITLIGMTDVSRYYKNDFREEAESRFTASLCKLCEQTDGFKVVLSHRPDLVKTYQKCGADIVFSGHAHGGQFRLPFIGGLYAPNQGFFPKYTAGKYMLGDTALIVNRGLGKSVIPFRINNRPEITAVTLVKK